MEKGAARMPKLMLKQFTDSLKGVQAVDNISKGEQILFVPKS
jgi:hypothetical protein